MWVNALNEGVQVICAKPTFLHGLDVPIKLIANSLAVLNQQTMEGTDHVHCFQTQLMKKCLVVWFWVNKRAVSCFFLYKNSLDMRVEQTLSLPSALKYFCLCSRCTARYTSVYKRARTTILGARNLRYTIINVNMLLRAQKNVYQDL